MDGGPRARTRLRSNEGALGFSLDPSVAESLHLTDGCEVEMRVEGNCLIVEAVPPQAAEHEQRVAEALEHVMEEHHEVLAALAK